MSEHDNNAAPAADMPALPAGDHWLTPKDLSQFCGLSINTLADYRSSRDRQYGPPYHKHGVSVYYRFSEVNDWIKHHAPRPSKERRS